jgi:hypothetical protein
LIIEKGVFFVRLFFDIGSKFFSGLAIAKLNLFIITADQNIQIVPNHLIGRTNATAAL